MDPLDHRLLAQQETKRLGDQVRQPVDLALGRPRQELLHHDLRLGGDSGHAPPIVLGEFLSRLAFADGLEPASLRASQSALRSASRSVQLLRLFVQ